MVHYVCSQRDRELRGTHEAAAGMSHSLCLAPGGGMDSSPGLQPGVTATNDEKPRTGRRSNHLMPYRPIGTMRSTTGRRLPLRRLAALFPASASPTKPEGVPYGKKVRATGSSRPTLRPVDTYVHGVIMNPRIHGDRTLSDSIAAP